MSHMRRDKLLNMEPSPLHACQPITLQEAERRIIREGEDSFVLSQEDEETSDLQATIQRNTEETSHHQGIISTEGIDGFTLHFPVFSY